MSSTGDLALEQMERLTRELRKDLASIEQMLAEFQADKVVKKNRIEEMALTLHFLAENFDSHINEEKPGDWISSIANVVKQAQSQILEFLKKGESDNFDLSANDSAIILYSEIRSRLMNAINAIEMVSTILRKYLDGNGEVKPLPSLKLNTSSTAPSSRLNQGKSAIIRSQELERQRIAREIHDGPAQAIANVVLRMDILSKIYEKDPSKIPIELARMKEIAQGALDEIRGFIFDLRPMTLQDLGLVATIKRVVTSVKELSGIDARFVLEGEEVPLGQLVSLAVFRIAQEALNNLRKYSKCKIAWVHLKYLKGKVVLVVEDDGIGFDPDHVSDQQKKYPSFGLIGMQERADDINAELSVISSPGQGTKVVLVVPTEGNPAMEIGSE